MSNINEATAKAMAAAQAVLGQTTYTIPHSGSYFSQGSVIWPYAGSVPSETPSQKITRLEREKEKIDKDLQQLKSLHPISLKLADLFVTIRSDAENARLLKLDNFVRTVLFSKKLEDIVNE